MNFWDLLSIIMWIATFGLTAINIYLVYLIFKDTKDENNN
jgi:hypothetical protein